MHKTLLSTSALCSLPLCRPSVACGKLRNNWGHVVWPVDQSPSFRSLHSAFHILQFCILPTALCVYPHQASSRRLTPLSFNCFLYCWFRACIMGCNCFFCNLPSSLRIPSHFVWGRIFSSLSSPLGLYTPFTSLSVLQFPVRSRWNGFKSTTHERYIFIISRFFR